MTGCTNLSYLRREIDKARQRGRDDQVKDLQDLLKRATERQQEEVRDVTK